MPDDTELTSFFIQVQDMIRNRLCPMYITHIRSHTGLPGPLAQGNADIDQLLIRSVLKASEFHRKHRVNSKGLKKEFSITWQQAKEIIKRCPIVLSITKHCYLQRLTQRILKGMKFGRWMCFTFQNLAN